MEVLYYLIFGGLIAFFIGYAIYMHHKDKKILKEREDHEKKRQSEPDWYDEAELSILNSERPFIDSYITLN